MLVEPQSARFSVEYLAEGLRAVIPARRNWFVMLFLGFWLCGWFMGETSVAGQLLTPGDKEPSLFLAFWLAGWTVGGAFAAGAVLWQFAGREIITVNSSELVYRAEVLGLGWSRS